ncbi:hypothetical protein [Alicyclobacillus shizuokensis]|uniref:hypothetical protein n=1 Tax=Alicyclobacillus shizuokensis TaxID=392014 RepID=UPI0012ED2CDE|nr:hypothetical protein [Alicyclobacillus shizuokensis]
MPRIYTDKFKQLLLTTASLPESEVRQTEVQFPLFDLIHNRDRVTLEELKQIDLQSIDFAMDSMAYCPTAEADNLEDAQGHPVYEWIRMKDLIYGFSMLPAAKRSVTFF